MLFSEIQVLVFVTVGMQSFGLKDMNSGNNNNIEIIIAI